MKIREVNFSQGQSEGQANTQVAFGEFTWWDLQRVEDRIIPEGGRGRGDLNYNATN